MHFKLIIALVEDNKTNEIIHAAREAGSTGATVINHARGEGLKQTKTFFGLNLSTQRDMVLFLVEEHLCREIIETIARVGNFDEPGTGIAFQLDVEDVIGNTPQINELTQMVEKEL